MSKLIQQVRCGIVCLLVLAAALLMSLQGAGAASSGSFRNSLLSRIDSVGSHRSTLAVRGDTRTRFRTEMRRLEHPKLGRTERLKYLADSSLTRASLVNNRIKRRLESTNWDSRMKAVPGEYGGKYAVSFSIGTPAQTFGVIVDTGSDLTWIQAKGCSSCFGQSGKAYDLSKSSSYKTLPCSSTTCGKLGGQSTCKGSSGSCTYTHEYGENSYTNGAYSTETITIASETGGEQRLGGFAFGVGLDNFGDFGDVDGLLGLGQGPISFPSQLGADYGNVFAYCLVNWSDSPSQTSPIIFGSDAVPTGDVQYTPLKKNSDITDTFWLLNLTGISVNGKEITVAGQQGPTTRLDSLDLMTLIDSGTSLSFLDTSVYQALSDSMSAAVTRYPRVSGGYSGLDLCFDTSMDDTPAFPGTTFHFEGADWELPQENTFLPIDAEGTWCLAVMGESNSGVQIIGNTQQQNFQVVFDQPKARLGWRKTQCDAL